MHLGRMDYDLSRWEINIALTISYGDPFMLNVMWLNGDVHQISMVCVWRVIYINYKY